MGVILNKVFLKNSMQTVIFKYFWVLIDMPPAVYKYKFIVDLGGGGGVVREKGRSLALPLADPVKKIPMAYNYI